MSVNIANFEVDETVEKVTSSQAYRKWDKKDNYLVSLFFLDDIWNVDFYSKSSKRITTFKVNSKVEKSQEEKIFQSEEKDLEELNLNEVKVKLSEALVIVELIKESKAPEESITKMIIILQQNKVPAWNITYVTSAFNILNVKINANNKKVISENFSSIFSLRKPN